MASKELPPMKPPAEKKPPLSPEAVDALARLTDENYGKPTPPPPAEPAPAPTPAPTEAPTVAPTPAPTAAPTPAPEAPAAPAVAKKPWEEPSGPPTAINFRPEQSLHDKMEWICNNIAKQSRLRLVREGVELICDQLIAKHYKEEA